MARIKLTITVSVIAPLLIALAFHYWTEFRTALRELRLVNEYGDICLWWPDMENHAACFRHERPYNKSYYVFELSNIQYVKLQAEWSERRYDLW